MKTIEEVLNRTGKDLRQAVERNVRAGGVPRADRRPSYLAWLVGVATVAALIAVAVSALTGPGEPNAADAPVGGGSWDVIGDSPIGNRSHMLTGWDGRRAVFWAGSNLARNFAHTDGFAFDPGTGEWAPLAVPGWGHPGLQGVYFEGVAYAAAKGGAVALDFETGRSTDLPPLEEMMFASWVVADDELWAVGPEGFGDETKSVAVSARFDTESGSWADVTPAGDFESGSWDQIFGGQQTSWTGSEIVVWDSSGHGVAFDTERRTWRSLPELEGDFTVVAVAADELYVLAQDATGIALSRLTDERWQDTGISLPDFDLDATHVAQAGEWIALFPPDDAPITIHPGSGTVVQHVNGPLGGRAFPNTVWTGEQLIVVGGERNQTDDSTDSIGGAIWTPPSS